MRVKHALGALCSTPTASSPMTLVSVDSRDKRRIVNANEALLSGADTTADCAVTHGRQMLILSVDHPLRLTPTGSHTSEYVVLFKHVSVLYPW